MVALPTLYWRQEGGEPMDMLISLIVTVMGGVVCHYVIRWLDRHDKGNK